MAIGPMTTNGAAPVTTDPTLKTPGVPADAKAVGDELEKKADGQEVENALANKSPTNHTHDLSALINALSTGTTTPQDADYYVSQYVGGGDATTTYHRRPMSALWAYIKGKADAAFAAKSHTHPYAGSGSAGGSANSAVKLDTATAGSATKPVYISGGKPVACTYSLGKDVPSNAVFTDHTYANMTAATASAAGKAGLVPAPAAGAQGRFLRGDGTWQAPTNTTYDVATQSAAGLMSAADKAKLDAMSGSDITASGKNYIRFSDGTQICWSATGTTIGGTYGSSRYAFPVPFIDTAYAVGGMKAQYISDSSYDNFYIAIKNTNYVEISSSHDTYSSGPKSTFIFIGRWK